MVDKASGVDGKAAAAAKVFSMAVTKVGKDSIWRGRHCVQMFSVRI